VSYTNDCDLSLTLKKSAIFILFLYHTLAWR